MTDDRGSSWPAVAEIRVAVADLLITTERYTDAVDAEQRALAALALVVAALDAAVDHDCRLRLNRAAKRVYCPLCEALQRLREPAA